MKIIQQVGCRKAGVWILSFMLLCSVAALISAIVEDCRTSANAYSIPQLAFRDLTGQGERMSTTLSDRLTLKSADRVAQVVEDSSEINDARDIDLGVVIQGEPVRQTFAIRNPTSRPFTITAIQKSCGCQTLELAEGTILPAGKVLKFAYGAPSSLPGRQSAKLVIKTDSTEESLREITLTLRAEVQAVITAVPSLLQYGNIDRGQSTLQELRVTALDSELLSRFQNASTTRGVLTATLAKQTPGALLIRVEVPSKTPPGQFNDIVILRFKGRDDQPLNIFVPAQGVVIPAKVSGESI